MVVKLTITFRETSEPIREPVAKFGGQPVWIDEPCWPLSRSTGHPMRFICQIPLSLVEIACDRMAYIFMNDEDEGLDTNWDWDSGENAVIVQPNCTYRPATRMPTGPTLKRWVSGTSGRQEVACEFVATLEKEQDPEYIGIDILQGWDEEMRQLYRASFLGNKIGGTPGFLQYPQIPSGEGWVFLAQIDSTRVPFSINFGMSGIGYIYVSRYATTGKFCWQDL